MSDFWSTTIPGYATGAGTVLLAATTAAVLLRDRRRDREQGRRDARTVFGFAGEREIPGARKGETSRMRSLTVVNAGSDPIFDVAVGSYEPDHLGHRLSGIYWQPGVHQSTIDFVLPGEREHVNGQWVVPVANPSEEDLPFEDAEILYWQYSDLPVVVAWTDGRGYRWQRHGSAEPEQLSRRE